MTQFYKPSGKFSSSFIVYFILLSLIAFPLLGLIYAYCIWYIPFIYINLFITLGFGFLVALCVNKLVIKKGKVRNPILALAIGFFSGIIALYFHWSIWIDLVINVGETYGSDRIGIAVSNIKFFQVFSLIFEPSLVFEYINRINEVGTWGIKGATVSGTFLWIIWAIEFALVVGVSSFLPYLESKKPFSESTNSWYEEITLPAFTFIENKEQLITDITSNNHSGFDFLNREVNKESDSHSVFTIYKSKSGKNYLTIDNKTSSLNSKGKVEFKSDEFVEYILIDSQLSTILSAK
jgi:hypothetical protein